MTWTTVALIAIAAVVALVLLVLIAWVLIARSMFRSFDRESKRMGEKFRNHHHL